MTKDIQQANVCGIAITQCKHSYWLVGHETHPIQIDSVLGSMWFAVPMDTYLWSDGLQIYEFPRNVWLPIGTIIEFYEHAPIRVRDNQTSLNPK